MMGYGIRQKSTGLFYYDKGWNENGMDAGQPHIFHTLGGARTKCQIGFPKTDLNDLEVVEFELVEKRIHSPKKEQ